MGPPILPTVRTGVFAYAAGWGLRYATNISLWVSVPLFFGTLVAWHEYQARKTGDPRVLPPLEQLGLYFGLLRILVTRKVFLRTGRAPPPNVQSEKFMSAYDAVGLIGDGATIAFTGLAANSQTSVAYTALRRRFVATEHPANLTVVCVGGIGGRGKAPGTLELMAVRGHVTRFITGHAETFKEFLNLAGKGECEFQIIPQGVISMIFHSLANDGPPSKVVHTGVGTFVDPRVGRGTCLAPPGGPQLVEVTGGGSQLKFTIPPPNVVIINAPCADVLGNVYLENASVLGEAFDLVTAVKKKGGIVIAQVGFVKETRSPMSPLFLGSNYFTAIVVEPNTEQTLGAFHTSPHMFLTPNHDKNESIEHGLAVVRFVNRSLGVTPLRTVEDGVVARLGAAMVAEYVGPGETVDMGTGLPEEIVAVLHESGVASQLRLITEAGAIGGVPSPGAFFGSSVHPNELVPSSQIFADIYQHLDCIIVGALQVDTHGNVNVSSRGGRVEDYVGPGGFMDFTCNARVVVFVSAFDHKGAIGIQGQSVRVLRKGRPKFVEHVDEITFCAAEALKRSQIVLYVTHIATFRLTSSGLVLLYYLPGVNVVEDIVKAAPGCVIDTSRAKVAHPSIVNGVGYNLSLGFGLY